MPIPKASVKVSVLVSSLCSAGLLLVAGCTHLTKPPAEAFVDYPPRTKASLRVGLLLSDELCSAQHERHSMGDTWLIPVGPNLCLNAETLARQLFQDVVVSRQESELKAANLDAILIPRLALFDRTFGATSFGKAIVALKLEWTLKSAAGKTLWADTVSGEGSGSTGWTNPEKIVKGAVEDLFRNSFAAISGVREVNESVAHLEGSRSRPE